MTPLITARSYRTDRKLYTGSVTAEGGGERVRVQGGGGVEVRW